MGFAELAAEIRELQVEELAQLKELIAQREKELTSQKPKYSPEEWTKLVNNFLDDFWGDTPIKEKEAIIKSIRFKDKRTGAKRID